MSASKKWIGAGIVIVAVAAAAVFGLPIYEAKQAAAIKAQLAALPAPIIAEKVEVSVMKKSVTLTKVQGTVSYVGKDDLTFTLGTVSASGVDLASLASVATASGPLKADSIVAADAVMNHKAAGISQTVMVKSMSMQNVSVDPSVGAKLGADASDIQRRLAVVGSFKAAAFQMEDYTAKSDVGFGPMTSRIKTGKGADISLLSMGKAEWSGATLNVFNSDVVTVDSFSINSAKLPDLIPLMAGLLDEKTAEATLMQLEKDAPAMFRKQPMVLDGMTLQGVTVRVPGYDAVTLKKAVFSMSFGELAMSMHKEVEGLEVPASIYRLAHPTAGAFAAAYKKPLSLSGGIDIQAKAVDGKPEWTVNNARIADQNLGGGAVDLNVIFTKQGTPFAWAGDGEPMLGKGRVMLEDKEFINFLLTALAAQGGNGGATVTPERMRQLLVGALNGQKDGMGPAAAQPLDALIKLLESSGKIVITVAPPTPISFEALEEIDSVTPDKIGAKVEYFPPAAK